MLGGVVRVSMLLVERGLEVRPAGQRRIIVKKRDARGSKNGPDRSSGASYVQRVENTWEVTQKREEDVDEERAAAATLEEYA